MGPLMLGPLHQWSQHVWKSTERRPSQASGEVLRAPGTRVRAFLRGTESRLLADVLGDGHVAGSPHEQFPHLQKKWDPYEGLGLEPEGSEFECRLVTCCGIRGL